MKAETAALNSLTTAQIGYGNSVSRARKEAEILQDLHNKGIQITPELRARVSELAAEWEKAAVANEAANERLERMEAIGKSVADSLSQAFENAFTDPQQALEDLGKQLAMLALKMQLARLFPTVFGSSGIVPLMAASGGYVRGPGTSTSDSVPARLSNGEFVVNAAATARNRHLLEAINSNKALALADGGYVGMPSLPRLSPARGAGAPIINIVNEGTPMEVARTDQRRGPNGEELVTMVVKDQMARGAFNGPMRSRYGMKSQKVVR